MNDSEGRGAPPYEVETQTILEVLQEHVCYYNMEMRVLWANAAACTSVGADLEALKGRYCWTIWPKTNVPCGDCPVILAMETGTPQTIEKMTPDGRWWLIKGYPVKDAQGAVIGGIETSMETTERKLVEAKLEEAYEILNRSPAVGFVWRNEPTWPVQYVTPNVAGVLGHSVEAFIEGTVAYEQVVHPDDLARVADEVETHSADLTCDAFSHEPYRIVSKDGSVKWVSDHTAIDRGPDGAPLHYKGIITDISAKVRSEQALLKVEKLRSLGVLAGGIAHDFNNYLTGVMGNLSLLRLEGRLDEASGLLLNEADEAVRRARELTQQLLTFSKGGAPVKRLCRLDRLVREAALFAQRGSGLRCICQLPEDLWLAEVDPGQLAQVVHHLVFNADQAMPQGGEIVISGENLTLAAGERSALAAGDYVVLTIQDRGTGIEQEHLDRIFDPYFTTKQRGSGLGLAVVHSVVEQHQGHISVESQLGEGTAVQVLLPALPKAVLQPMQPKETAEPGAGRVLVMDDESFIRSLASKILQRDGYEVTTAEEGEEAIRLYQQGLTAGRRFDVVILDLTIAGGMGGAETVRRLLQIDEGVKAIVSSGYSGDPVMSNYASFGFEAALGKPYKVEEMSAVVRSVLEPTDEGS
jgi:PAS domain S-box-containing protein